MEIGDIVIYREEGMTLYEQDCPAIVMGVQEGEEHPNLDLKVFTHQGDFDLRAVPCDCSGHISNTWRYKHLHTLICDDKESKPELSSSTPAEGSGD